MARRQRAVQQEAPDPVFMGSSFSNQELEFLIEHFGEPSEVAMPEDEDLPEGVNPKAVGPVLDRTYRLHLMETAAKDKHGEDVKVWVGFDALKRICEETLQWNATVRELKERTRGAQPEARRAAGAPSLHLWDADTDIPYLYGVGADAEFTRTAINQDGSRTNLFTELRDSGIGGIKSLTSVAKFLRGGRGSDESAQSRQMRLAPTSLVYGRDGAFGNITCPVCRFSVSYEVSKPSTKKEAEQEMRKHLDTAKLKKEVHRILLKRITSGRGQRTELQKQQRVEADTPKDDETNDGDGEE